MRQMVLLLLQKKCVLRILITHKNPPSSAGLEPATVGPMASTPSTRPPKAALKSLYSLKIHTGWYTNPFLSSYKYNFFKNLYIISFWM
jgi:hypothetical protein